MFFSKYFDKWLNREISSASTHLYFGPRFSSLYGLLRSIRWNQSILGCLGYVFSVALNTVAVNILQRLRQLAWKLCSWGIRKWTGFFHFHFRRIRGIKWIHESLICDNIIPIKEHIYCLLIVFEEWAKILELLVHLLAVGSGCVLLKKIILSLFCLMVKIVYEIK